MLCNHLFCIILFIPTIYGGNSTSVKPITVMDKPEVSNKTNHLNESVNKKLHEKKFPALTVEGGSLLPDVPLTLATVNDVGKNDQKSGIVARKGAILTDDSVKLLDKNDNLVNNSTELNKLNKINKTVSDIHANIKNYTTAQPPVIKTNNTVNSSEKPMNKTEIHKPLKVSYDELAKSKPSSETFVYQYPRQHSSKVAGNTSHPGMVIPIVITILLVPMFAVLGYMALRRGQEAWKNRHYKRVDFLLDGMYND